MKQTAFPHSISKLVDSSLIILLIAVLLGCDSKSTQSNVPVSANDALPAETKAIQEFPDLVPNEVELNDDCFGEIINLHGQHKKTTAIFEVKGTQMLVKDSLLIVANRNSENVFMIFSLPDFRLIKSFGKIGRGPGEFLFPDLVPADNDDCLCYIYERINEHLFELNRNLSISELPYKLAEIQYKLKGNYKQIVSFSPNRFIYVESIKGGKAIFDCRVLNDSTQTRMIYDLSFSEAHKSYASYIGDFGANAEKQRAVYAYQYFKRLVFIDLKNNTSRVVNFSEGEAQKGNNSMTIMSPENITQYWKMSAQKNYVYVLYSGRSPIEVREEWQRNEYYIFVEKFDWNGNPIAKYRLDNCCYFCADESRGKFYMASANDAEPFVEFNFK